MQLFDTSPIEDENGKKAKKSRRQKQVADQPASQTRPAYVEPVASYLASIDGHCVCQRCGMTVVDLVDARQTDQGPKWLVQCGWWCLLLFLIDPIPGLLDEEDKKQKDVFRVRGGRFDGKTLAEIDASGNRWYIEALASESKRAVVKQEAKIYLTGLE